MMTGEDGALGLFDAARSVCNTEIKNHYVYLVVVSTDIPGHLFATDNE